MNVSSLKLSVVIPVYGSEKILPELYKRLKALLESVYPTFEIIFVDDCGPGDTWNIISELARTDRSVQGIQLMKNSGQGSATICGIAECSGDIIVTLDDDLQHRPEDIPSLVDALLEDEDCDVIIGAPIEKKHSGIRRLGSNLINRMNSVFLKKDPELRFTGFRAMHANAAKSLTTIQTPYPALGPMIITVTRRVKNIPINHDPRMVGKSNYSFKRILKQTLSNFIGYSMLPLRILAVIGFAGIAVSVILGIYYLARYFIVGISTTGWTTLVLLLVSFSGFNFFAFAVIGEYLLRIMQISTSTPQYSVRKTTKKQGT